MADSKVSQLPALALINGNDLILIIDDPSGTPTSKKVSINDLFAAIPSNAVFQSLVTVQGNTSLTGTVIASGNVVVNGTVVANNDHIKINNAAVVASNNASTVFGAGAEGKIAWDSNYLYVAVSNTVIKRAALSTFS